MQENRWHSAGPSADTPSPWIARFAGLVPAGGPVLDLACGRGRHARLFTGRGHPVTAVDRDREALAALGGVAGIEALAADLEDGSPFPLAGRTFAGIVVANYLWRPLVPALLAALAPGGALLWETFAAGNEAFGRPRNPDFLLRPGELLEMARGTLEVVAFEDGRIDHPRPAMVQRIAAVRPPFDRATARLHAASFSP
ncbi:MAG: class I SAM-dependent methyltransferase [Alphaproteobacteria bacterium]